MDRKSGRQRAARNAVSAAGYLCITLAIALLWGCAGTEVTPVASDQAVTRFTDPDYVLARTAKRRPPEKSVTTAGKLLALSPQMREFLAGIDPELSPKARFREILRILNDDQFEMEYNLNHTTSASELFALRRGNCISFAAMIVALAREAGLEAHFNFVEIPRSRAYTTTAGGAKLQQNVLHINAEVSFGWYTKVIDINFSHRPPFPHRKLADEEVAMFYLNNLAVEAAQKGELTTGFGYMQEALKIEPDSTMLWTTLGYLHRLDGSLSLANLSYSHALNLDNENILAINNLRRVYKMMDARALSSVETSNTQEEIEGNRHES